MSTPITLAAAEERLNYIKSVLSVSNAERADILARPNIASLVKSFGSHPNAGISTDCIVHEVAYAQHIERQAQAIIETKHEIRRQAIADARAADAARAAQAAKNKQDRERMLADPVVRGWVANGGQEPTLAEFDASNFLVAALAIKEEDEVDVSVDDKAAADFLISMLPGRPKPAAGRAKSQPPAPARSITAEEAEFQRVFGPGIADARARHARGL